MTNAEFARPGPHGTDLAGAGGRRSLVRRVPAGQPEEVALGVPDEGHPFRRKASPGGSNRPMTSQPSTLV